MTRYRAPPITHDLFKIETVTVLPVYSDTRSITRVINEIGLIPVTQSKLLKIVISKQARHHRAGRIIGTKKQAETKKGKVEIEMRKTTERRQNVSKQPVVANTIHISLPYLRQTKQLYPKH